MTSIEETIRICARNVKRLRTSRHVTQAHVAEKVGITEKYLSDIETGRKFCSLDTLVAIANCLEVEPYELLLPENRGISYDSHRTQVMMEQLKSDFTRMVDTIGTFLEEGKPSN